MKSLLSLIAKKRDGEVLSPQDIQDFVTSLTSKAPPPDYQIASLLAFILCRGMNSNETQTLTAAMRKSGKEFSFPGFSKSFFVVDKHSTGGLGDKITLPLIALTTAASETILYPSIAGRALGHTGGTIDKLESIPGFRTDYSVSDIGRLMKKTRACIVAQSREITPADRVLYQMRDATGTVESIPLITASILSKKLSESLDHLLLDLKCGSGAFLRKMSDSDALAQSMLEVCRLSEQSFEICMTRMDTPLGHFSGNRLEVEESLQILEGRGPEDSLELTQDFAKRLLVASGISEAEAKSRLVAAFRSGAAMRQFERLVEVQEGSLSRFLKRKPRLKTKILSSPRSGFLRWDVRSLGVALVELGAGRKVKDQKIDHDVGFYHPIATGTYVEKDQELLRIYYNDTPRMNACLKLLQRSFEICEEPFAKTPLILKNLRT